MPAGSTLPPLISSDGHLEVRPERWTPRMPAKLREKAPRTIKLPDGGDAMLDRGPAALSRAVPRSPRGANERDLAAVRRDGRRHRRGGPARAAACASRTRTACSPRCCSPTCRWARGSGATWRTRTPIARRCAPTTTGWRGVLPGVARPADRARRHPVDEPRRRHRRARALRRLGLKGVNLGVFPSGKSYPTPEDDTFWAAAIDMGMPLTVHVGFDRLGPRASQPTFEYPGADPRC